MKITIIQECSDFLKESSAYPMFKLLPKDGPDSRKVKIRKRKTSTPFDEAFNNVFIDHPDLRQRCVFANGAGSINMVAVDPALPVELFYIFPIDGYKFMYSSEVYDSSKQYSEALEKLTEAVGEEEAQLTFSEVLRYDYVSEKFTYGLMTGCEIIIYGIPYFYAVRESTLKSYSTLFSL
jgi:hypothetical protein